jgi:hypothetical protein
MGEVIKLDNYEAPKERALRSYEREVYNLIEDLIFTDEYKELIKHMEASEFIMDTRVGRPIIPGIMNHKLTITVEFE